jgi:hypothetical protein
MHIGAAHREGGVCGGGGLESDDVDDSPAIKLRQEARGGGGMLCAVLPRKKWCGGETLTQRLLAA